MVLEKNVSGYGGYSAYNYLLFQQNGNDEELTRQMAVSRIREILEFYRQYPGTGLEFFKEKILWQWVDPTFTCFHSTNLFKGQGLSMEIYRGKYREMITDFMNSYQNIVYFGLFVGCAVLLRKKIRATQMIIPVVFIGFFFFSAIWEARPRYMFTPFVLMVPFAANGMECLLQKIDNLRVGRSRHE